MSLLSLILAFAPALAPKNHTSSVEEKINAAENDALDLAAILIDVKAELEDMRQARDTALNALAAERDVTISLRREVHDLTISRDYAFSETRAARNLAYGLQLELDTFRAIYSGNAQQIPNQAQSNEQLRAQTEFASTAIMTPNAEIPYPAPSEALLEARAAMQQAQALMNMPVFAGVPVHSSGDGPMQVSDPGHSHLPGEFVMLREARDLWRSCTCVPGRSNAFRRG